MWQSLFVRVACKFTPVQKEIYVIVIPITASKAIKIHEQYNREIGCPNKLKFKYAAYRFSVFKRPITFKYFIGVNLDACGMNVYKIKLIPQILHPIKYGSMILFEITQKAVSIVPIANKAMPFVNTDSSIYSCDILI